MKILGLHAIGHDTGACLIVDDEICCFHEERLTRIKYDGSFPEKSIQYALSYFGLKNLNSVDLIVIDIIERRTNEVIRKIREKGYKNELISIKHHDAHASSAFFVSPFSDAAILSVDGFGSAGCEAESGKLLHYLHSLQESMVEIQTIYRGENNKLYPIRRTITTNEYRISVGIFYAIASVYLGFGELEAGKLMALSAYGGKFKKFKENVFIDFEGELLIKENKNFFEEGLSREENLNYFGKEYFCGIKFRRENEPIKKGHAEIAYYVQKETEKAVLHLVNNLYNCTKSDNLCIAGGVGLNCLTNSLILEKTAFKNVFVQPAATDCGIALGCALYGYHIIKGMPRKYVMENVFLGSEYKDREIISLLKRTENIKYSKPKYLTKKIAKYISEGKIVGWFEGRSELGPRALGHRSIFADPRCPEMKDILNEKVKRREWFRPYAPAVLEEYASEYFEINCRSPFMLYAPKVREEKRNLIPAVIHIDGTSRLQTVSKKNNPQFYNLIKEFHKITAIPMVLNTSFNVAGEPIVETPEDALKLLPKTEMDYLVIEDYIVRLLKKSGMEIALHRINP